MTQEDDHHNDLADWEANADRYAEVTASPQDSVSATFRGFLHASLGDVSGLSVLDLGCGSGWLSAEIEDGGGRVVGIDGSARLLQIARERHPDLEFIRADLTQGLPDLGARRFDRVVAQMLLADMGELDRLMLDVSHSLVASGRFIFTIAHPFSNTPLATVADDLPARSDGGDPLRYLEASVRWVTAFGGHRHYHRPLHWYVNLLADSGMAVVRLFESDVVSVGQSAPARAHHADLLGIVAVPVTPGLPLPVGRKSKLVDNP